MSEHNHVFAKCAWRLIPFIALLYVANYIDRVNVGFAALTMNQDVGLSPTQFGFGAGILFVSYALSQIPASLVIERIGPRRAIFGILLAWGAISAANAFVISPLSFYVLRFSLGVAEAGFFPGMIFYLSLWFPKAYLGRCIGFFQASNPLAVFLSAPLSGLILGLTGYLSLRGWQWRFCSKVCQLVSSRCWFRASFPMGPCTRLGSMTRKKPQSRSGWNRKAPDQSANSPRCFSIRVAIPSAFLELASYLAKSASSFGRRRSCKLWDFRISRLVTSWVCNR
jgi:MFS transporter, ACS family, tartrate transporter